MKFHYTSVHFHFTQWQINSPSLFLPLSLTPLVHHLQQLQSGNMERVHNQHKLSKGQERQMLLIPSIIMMCSITQCQEEQACLFSQLSLLFPLLKNLGQEPASGAQLGYNLETQHTSRLLNTQLPLVSRPQQQHMPPSHIIWPGEGPWANGRANSIAKSSFAPLRSSKFGALLGAGYFPLIMVGLVLPCSHPASSPSHGSSQILFPQVPCPMGKKSLLSSCPATNQSAPWKLL